MKILEKLTVLGANCNFIDAFYGILCRLPGSYTLNMPENLEAWEFGYLRAKSRL